MNGPGTVTAIHVASGAETEMEDVESAEAVAGQGLRGDRYFEESGSFSDGESDGRDLTLIEAEAIEAIEHESGIDISFADHRRNVTTRDVALNHLVGEQFRVGEVVCEGVMLCEPCSHLQSLTEDGVLEALIHRGGLRANIIDGGTIRAGDEIGRV